MLVNGKCLCTCALTLGLVCALASAVAQKNPDRPLVGHVVSHVTRRPSSVFTEGKRSGVFTEGKRYGSSARNDVRRYPSVPSTHVTEGHRLITRALWRIFDALMQKKDHAQLYSRMTFVEEALKKMISVDTQLEDEIDKLKDDMVVCKNELNTVMEELGKFKSFNTRLEQLEESRSRSSASSSREFRGREVEYLEDVAPESHPLPQGDQVQAGWAAAAYSSCPEPFKKVDGECFFLANEEMMGWEDARRECGRLGGDLASPRNLRGLRAYLNGVKSPPEYLWVGGSMIGESSWVWSSGPQAGVPVDMSKETWNEEVPNGPGKCMGLFGESSYRAYNYDCKEKDFFVCQYFF